MLTKKVILNYQSNFLLNNVNLMEILSNSSYSDELEHILKNKYDVILKFISKYNTTAIINSKTKVYKILNTINECNNYLIDILFNAKVENILEHFSTHIKGKNETRCEICDGYDYSYDNGTIGRIHIDKLSIPKCDIELQYFIDMYMIHLVEFEIDINRFKIALFKSIEGIENRFTKIEKIFNCMYNSILNDRIIKKIIYVHGLYCVMMQKHC